MHIADDFAAPVTSGAAPQLEHAQLTSLINSMADGVLAVDRFTKVTVYNGAVLNILDTNGSIIHQPLDHFMHITDHNNQPVDIVKYVRGIKAPTIDDTLRLVYADGSSISLYLSISPVTASYQSAKSKGGYVLVLRDITRTKSLEEERDEFISVVSHELRTPIAITEGNISNAIFVAKKAGSFPGDESIKRALSDSHEQVLFLASMINDLSTLSRAERGKLVADIAPINVHELVAELTEDYRAGAEKKGLRLHSTASPKLELLQSSQLYVREILQNFVTNAIKYTEKGSVSLEARPREGGVVFRVTDTGIGISHADQEKLFDKFFRSEDYRTRQHSGTGLGLYITLKLARLLHAEIDVKSELDGGSSFTIYIPNLK